MIYHESDGTAVLILGRKAEFFEAFKPLVNLWKTQYEVKLKRIYADNGGEFVNKSMQSWLEARVIMLRLTNPYTAERNGLAERRNRTLVEMSRAASLACRSLLARGCRGSAS